MARYKKILYQGETHLLKCGETLEDHLRQTKIPSLAGTPQNSEVKHDGWISTPYGLMMRSSFKRSHHRPKQFVERPRFGKGSGRTGGGRTGRHYQRHVRFYPGTDPTNCPVCQHGLAAAVRSQGKVLHSAGGRRWTEPRESPVLDDRPYLSIDDLEGREQPVQIRDMTGAEI